MAVSLSACLASAQVRVGWTTNIPAAWEFDTVAIARACHELGVTGEVEVGCAEYARGRWQGMYSHERGIHRVRVGRRVSVEAASRILWHELTHALQHERGEREGTTRLRGDAYRLHPKEVEARSNEYRAELEPLAHA